MKIERTWLASTLSLLAVLMVLPCNATSLREGIPDSPKPRRFCSSNAEYCVKILPKFRGPKARLLRRRGKKRYKRVITFPLVNRDASVTALVSNDGRYVVVIDDRGSSNENAISIYRGDGTLIKSFGLDTVLKQDEKMPLLLYAGSTDWSGDHFLREDDSVLVLRIAEPLCANPPGPRGFFGVEVDLATGELLDPARPPRFRYEAVMIDPPSESAEAEPSFAAELDRKPLRVTSSHLREHLLESATPEYPSIAKKARIQGMVLLEVLVSESGEVEHVEVIKGLPMGLEQASVTSIRQWRFKPFRSEGVPTPAVGQVALSFRCIDTTTGDPP